MTFKIMWGITGTGYVLDESLTLMKELQNDYEQGDTWTVSIMGVNPNTTLSLVSYEKKLLDENFTLPLDEIKNYTFAAETNNRLLVIADDFIKANITNEQGEVS